MFISLPGIIVSKLIRRPLTTTAPVDSKRYVLKNFASLTFDVAFEWQDPIGSNFELMVSARGPQADRDRWQRAFQGWCDLHGQNAEIIRGNVRTNRTATRTVVSGPNSLDRFIFQWIGREWHRHAQEDQVSAGTNAAELKALGDHASKLAARLRLHATQPSGRRRVITRSRPVYSARLAAFSKI